MPSRRIVFASLMHRTRARDLAFIAIAALGCAVPAAFAVHATVTRPSCAAQSGPSLQLCGVRRGTGMGIDRFGHTRLSEERTAISPDGLAHTERLLNLLRANLERYRDPAVAERDGYRKEGEDVPVGALKHFINARNLAKNYDHLDPEAPAAILYRRTRTGFELAGVMFTAPIGATMDELDRRVPLALGHWHSHRNICVPHPGAVLSSADRKKFGFSGSIATRSECVAAGGVFLDNVYGWMAHVYPFAPTLADAF